jgi:hypothetical protein
VVGNKVVLATRYREPNRLLPPGRRQEDDAGILQLSPLDSDDGTDSNDSSDEETAVPPEYNPDWKNARIIVG